MQNPHILYWKWNDDIFEDGVLERKTNDIINRSIFDCIYISFHFISPENRLLSSDALIRKIELCNSILMEHGRKMVVDLDIGMETDFFKTLNTTEKVYTVKAVSGSLDENGFLTTESESFDKILKCWYAENLENAKISGALEDITECAEVIDGKVHVNYPKPGNVICYISKARNTYDVLGEEFKQYRKMVFDKVSHIPLGGVAVDEWGLGPALDIPDLSKERAKDKWAFSNLDKELDASTMPIFVTKLNYTDGMEKAYRKRYGKSLLDELLYLWYYEEGNLQKSIDTVNRYVENIRIITTECEEEFYNLGKEYFGNDCFIACHPTWWGDEFDNSFDRVKNGLDWWEVKRDYAQTDELIPIPVRLAMSRKCPEQVWYNMWYSMRTMDINTYYKETWINARFGGRTHHLGYECNEPGIVLELYPEGMMESLSVMEEKISLVNEYINSRPDTRVLVLFGYEAITNWKLSDKECLYLDRIDKNMNKVLKFTTELFNYPYLCELAPTSEIENGSIVLSDNKISYMGHKYDAVILLLGEGMSKKSFDVLKAYDEVGGNLIIVEEPKCLKTGEKTDYRFKSPNIFDRSLSGEDAAKILKNMGILPMCTKNSCVYEDGSVIYTSDGALNVNNPIKIDTVYNGKKVSFIGKDFIVLRKAGDNIELCTESGIEVF